MKLDKYLMEKDIAKLEKISRREALKIYKSGQDVVIKTLCDMDDEVSSLKKIIKSKQMTITNLSKNSSNSSKHPSSDDIIESKGKRKRGKEHIRF